MCMGRGALCRAAAGAAVKDWRTWARWALMVIAVGAASDPKSGGAGIALAVLVAAHIVAAAIRGK